MNTPKLILCFLGGAGGNFISNMLFNLQHPLSLDIHEYNDNHFHRACKSRDIKLVHHHEDNCKIYTGNFKFNQYLNVVYKFNILDNNADKLPSVEQIEKYNQVANFSLKFFSNNIDINYDDIYLNETKFIYDCFDVFDQSNILYKKDYSIAYKCLKKFKNTCINPNKDFMNWDSLVWIGWCLGIDKHFKNDCPLFSTLDQAQEYLYPRRVLYGEITKQYNMVFFDV